MVPNEASNVIPISSRSPFDLTKTYLIASGTPILPKEYKQPENTVQALHDFAVATEGDFLKEMDKISRALKIRTQYPGVKSMGRIAQKADVEKGGHVDQVFDVHRIALIADRAAQIKRAIDFFSPGKNSRVVDMIDQFAVPDSESRIRRAKIIYRSESGMLGEIQIWSSKMLNAFEESHTPYEHQRKLKAELKNSASELPFKTYAQLQAKERILEQTRCAIHDDAAAEAGLDKFVETRTFGRIGSTPIVAIERPIDEYPTILRPDAKTGLYVTDNSLYSDFVSGNYVRSNREDFLRASHALAINHVLHMKREGQELPAPLAHYEIA